MHLKTFMILVAAGSNLVLGAAANNKPRVNRKTITPAAKSAAAKPAAAPNVGGSSFPPITKQAAKPARPRTGRLTQSKHIRPSLPDTSDNSPQLQAAPITEGQGTRQQNIADVKVIAENFVEAFDKQRTKKKKPNSDDQPYPYPIVEVHMETYNGNYNDARVTNNNQQTAMGGGTIAAAGASVDNTRTQQIDNTSQDNRQIAQQGATITGAGVQAGRNGLSAKRQMQRRSLSRFIDVLDIEFAIRELVSRSSQAENPSPLRTFDAENIQLEDNGIVALEDLVVLVRAMRRDTDVKDEVMFDFAADREVRSMIEQLIAEHTNTNGDFSMNNFAALVEAAQLDARAQKAILGAFNKSIIFAAIVERLMFKNYRKADLGSLDVSKRNALEQDVVSLDTRDVDDEDLFWFGARDLEDASDFAWDLFPWY